MIMNLPILPWLYGYDVRKSLLGDISAGLTIFAFVIPHSMALSSFLGLPPIHGLYSCIFPSYIYAIVGPNQKLSMGPMAIVTLILAVDINSLGYTKESSDLTSIVLSATFLIGLCSLVMGVLNLGWISKYISPSVLIGFVSASGISIGINQAKYILGIKVPSFRYLHETVFYLCVHINEANKYSITLGLSTWLALYLITLWKKTTMGDEIQPSSSSSSVCSNTLREIVRGASKFSSFLALLIGAIVSRAMILHGCELDVVGLLPSGLLKPTLPVRDVSILIKLLPTAIVITLVSFATNLSIAMKFDKQIHATHELIAFGLANVLSTLTNSFVSTGAVGRSSINVESGATTQMSAVISSSLVLVSVLFFSSAFYYIPMTVLAAVIEANVPVMIDFPAMMKAYHTKRGDFIVMMAAFLVTLFVGESEGLFVGVVVSFMMLIHQVASPSIAHLGKLPESEGGQFRDVRRFPSAEQIPGIAIVRMDATLFFANCEHFKDVIMQAVEGHYHTSPVPIEKIVIDAKCWIDIDLAGIEALTQIKQELNRLPLTPTLVLANAHEEIVHVLGSPLVDDRFRIVLTIDDAVAVCALLSMEVKAVDNTADEDRDSNANTKGVGSLMTSTHLYTKLSPAVAMVNPNQASNGMLSLVHNALKVTAPGSSSSSSRNSYVKLAIHDDASSSSSSSLL